MVYYNEFDPFAASWLRNLMADGLIPQGDVDERDIREVSPDDLRGYAQCHFFAGIGGWPYALRLAGWPDDRECWTGSCPCQPLSSAGKRQGHADERHLWPAFHSLIAVRRPPVIFGEQVASKDGREWFAGVRADLEDTGYACGGADLCAAGVGAPQNGPRLYWVAAAHGGQIAQSNVFPSAGVPTSRRSDARGCGGSFWSSARTMEGADNSRRRIEPGIFPLAHGVSNRVGLLRGAGNAIVPQAAAEFVMAYLEADRGQ